MTTIGVLALQGDFLEHRKTLETLGVDVNEVRLPADLEHVQALIVPGGESTTIGMLAKEYGIESAVRERLARDSKFFVWGTCAGAVWLSKTIQNHPQQAHLGVLDAEISRNGYGRQLDSFETDLEISGVPNLKNIKASFIRAPRFVTIGSGVEVLAKHNGEPVLVRQKNLWASTFHSELGSSTELHAAFARSL